MKNGIYLNLHFHITLLCYILLYQFDLYITSKVLSPKRLTDSFPTVEETVGWEY
jgi:hypothetical protein